MANTIEVKVPDIGGHENVPVIEVMVKPGDTVANEQSLITLESDKATMEIPSSGAGTVKEVKLKVGDEVSEGTVIVVLEAAGEAGVGSKLSTKPGAGDEGSGTVQGRASAEPSPAAARHPLPAGEGKNAGEGSGTVQGRASAEPSPAAARHPLPAGEGKSAGEGSGTVQGRASAEPSPAAARHPLPAGEGKSAAPASGRKADVECQVLVLGSGPGGYTAAFRAADLGQDTVLVERYGALGGVCLNVGCIPSKALLHAAAVIDEAAAMGAHGIAFGKPKLDLDKLRDFKNQVVGKLTGGLATMAKQRKVCVLQGTGRFVSPHELEVEGADGKKRVRFEKAIIAAGSQALKLPGLPWDDERVMDSTGALELRDVPGKLLVIGGGIIGLEMATVYAALGSEVTVVELAGQLMPGTDADLVRPLQQRIARRYKGIHLKTRVVEATARRNGIEVKFEGESIPATSVFDRVLVAVGRAANGDKIGADRAGVAVGERGLIAVDRHRRTNVPHIFAIGDLVGQPMLAHKATHEGKVAAEVCAGTKSAFDARAIPSVAYTDPEIAWVGLTEREAKDAGVKFGVGKFPWAASGRAIGIDRTEGFTKLIFDEETRRIIGAGIVGVHAGDLISELALAIEMGCEAADIALTIHPHPTLGESVGMAAEVYEGTITDLYLPKKK